MTIEGHERCISLEQFNRLQELHDNQKKIIASLRQKIQDLEQEIRDLTLDKADLD
jgi:archaellum component FlaC